MQYNAKPSRIPTASSAHNVYWNRKEVAMAAIAFNDAHQAEQAGERLKTVLTLLRRMLDAFVSYRMRLAASEADHARPRQLRITSSHPKNGQ
jgi:glutaminase